MPEKNIGGNYYDKYNSKNPLVRLLMDDFCRVFTGMVGREPFSTLLDVGCGEGHLTEILERSFKSQNRSVSITALEYDANTVRDANKMHPGLNVMQGDILALKGKYDILTAAEVLEHVAEYGKAVEECIKASPVCVFSVPNEPWFRMANICRLKYLERLGNTPGHVNNWSKNGFRDMLGVFFEKIDIRTSGLWNIAVCKEPKTAAAGRVRGRASVAAKK